MALPTVAADVTGLGIMRNDNVSMCTYLAVAGATPGVGCAGKEHQRALLALQGQLNSAVAQLDVLRAGAGHAKDEALAALKVWPSR